MKTNLCSFVARIFYHPQNALPFILCGILLMSGCSRSDEASSSNANSGAASKAGTGAKRNKVNACSLMTKAEAEKSLGEAASDGGTNEKDLGATGGSLTVCSYSASKRPA